MDVAKIVFEFLEFGDRFYHDQRTAALDLDIKRLAGIDTNEALHVSEAVDFGAVDSDHEIARLEASFLRGTSRLHRIDAGAGCLLANCHENEGENNDRQNEIRNRAGRDNGRAGT